MILSIVFPTDITQYECFLKQTICLLVAFPFADEMSHGKMAIQGPGGSWLFSPETGDTETLKKSPGTAERMASLIMDDQIDVSEVERSLK